MDIISRKNAKQNELTKYFTGKPCKYNHISERATRNGECLVCASIRLNEWRKNNPEKKAQHRKKHKKLHLEREKESYKKWLQNPENKEKHRILKNKATSVWAKNNREKRNFNQSKRRALKLQRTPYWLNDGHFFEIECIYKYCNALRNIGLDYHVDHIVPLNGKSVSGFHIPWNLQVISAKQNLSKSNRITL